MSDQSIKFKSDSNIAFNEEHWQKMNYNTGCFEKRFANSHEQYRNLELERQRAYLLRNKSLLNMEKLLVDFETHFKENGGHVLWARDVDDAQEMILELVSKRDIHGVMRSNSVVLDEIELDELLTKNKVPYFENSVARYILKLAGQAPYHPVFHTLNLSPSKTSLL